MFQIREYNFDNGNVIFTGTEEECKAYLKEMDKGYAGVRPIFHMEPCEETVE